MAAWDTLIKRAETLRAQRNEAAELLTFYSKLLGAQKRVYEYIRSRRNWRPSGWLAQDLSEIQPARPPLLETVIANGPALLANDLAIKAMRSMGVVYFETIRGSRCGAACTPAKLKHATGRDPRADYSRALERQQQHRRESEARARRQRTGARA
jgi:hypothetical protein